MADEVASISVKVGADISGLQKGMASVVGTLRGLAGIVGVAFGTRELLSFGKECIKTAADAQTANIMFSQSLGSIGLKYSEVSSSSSSFFSTLSRTSAFLKEDLVAATTRLIQVTQNYGESLKLTSLAADLARARHIDMRTAADLLGRVYEGNTGILKRYGIVLREGATATEALDELQKRFSGSAAAYGNSAAGAFDKFNNKIHELKERLGTDFMPVAMKFIDIMSKSIPKIEAWISPLEKFVNLLIKAAELMNKLNINNVIAGWAIPKVADASGGGKTGAAGGSKALPVPDFTPPPAAASNWTAFMKTAKTSAAEFTTAFASNMASGFHLFEKGCWDMQGAFAKAIDSMIAKLIQSGIIKLVSMIFGGIGLDISDIVSPEGKAKGGLPGYASGGWVTSPTLAMVGEQEPELITPLSQISNIGGSTSVYHITIPTLINQMNPQVLRDTMHQIGQGLNKVGYKPA